MYKILYYQSGDWEVLAEKYAKKEQAIEWAKTFKNIFECRTKVVPQNEEVLN
jgi:hypothetical protein